MARHLGGSGIFVISPFSFPRAKTSQPADGLQAVLTSCGSWPTPGLKIFPLPHGLWLLHNLVTKLLMVGTGTGAQLQICLPGQARIFSESLPELKKSSSF